MGLTWAEHTVEIEAPIETCFDAIVDYETFPRWQQAVEQTEVLDRDRDGLGRRVRLHVDAKVRVIDYTLDYRYERPTRIEWEFVEGNGMNDVDGEYIFEELGSDRTRATYRLGVEPGIPIPRPVARRIHKQTLKRSVQDLKKEAEHRHSAGRRGSTRPKRRLGILPSREPEPTEERPIAPEEQPGEERRVPETGLGSVTQLPRAAFDRASALGRDAAGGTARAGRDAAGGAMRIALGAAGAAFGVARQMGGSVARRVDRLLSGEDRGQGSNSD